MNATPKTEKISFTPPQINLARTVASRVLDRAVKELDRGCSPSVTLLKSTIDEHPREHSLIVEHLQKLAKDPKAPSLQREAAIRLLLDWKYPDGNVPNDVLAQVERLMNGHDPIQVGGSVVEQPVPARAAQTNVPPINPLDSSQPDNPSATVPQPKGIFRGIPHRLTFEERRKGGLIRQQQRRLNALEQAVKKDSSHLRAVIVEAVISALNQVCHSSVDESERHH